MTKLFFDSRCFVCGYVIFIMSCQCFSGESNTDVASFEVLSKRIDAAIKFAETNEIARSNSDVRSQTILYATQLINTINRQGDHAALPYLEEKSLNTAIPEIIRRRAAAAYVNIADMEETVAFMKKMNADPSVKGTSWLYFLNEQILGKFAVQEKQMDAGTKEKFFSCLLDIIQTSKNSCEVQMVNRFLLERIPGYSNSMQRATLNRYANTGNDWVTNTFNPVKAHFDKIPPSKRTDLRKRFPDLPPLPEDKNADMPLKTTLSIGAALAAFIFGCLVIWIMAKRRKTQT